MWLASILEDEKAVALLLKFLRTIDIREKEVKEKELE